MTAAQGAPQDEGAPPLRWRRRTAYSLESDRGGYRISKTGPEGAEIYTAWAPGPWHQWDHYPLGHYNAKDEAIEACNDHDLRRGSTDEENAT